MSFFLPGGDTAESAATIAHNLHITAIIVLGCLFLSEGMALIYDTRKDHLLSAAATKAETQRTQDAETAETRRKAEVGGLQQQLSEAAKKVSELERQRTPRRLSDGQRAQMAVTLTPYKGQRIQLHASAGDVEANGFAKDFAAAFAQAGIDYKNGEQEIAQSMTMPPLVGIEVSVSEVDAQASRAPPAYQAVMNAMNALGLLKSIKAVFRPELKTGEMRVLIGAKPSD